MKLARAFGVCSGEMIERDRIRHHPSGAKLQHRFPGTTHCLFTQVVCRTATVPENYIFHFASDCIDLSANSSTELMTMPPDEEEFVGRIDPEPATRQPNVRVRVVQF